MAMGILMGAKILFRAFQILNMFILEFCERVVDTQASLKVFDRGKRCSRSRVMVNYRKNIVFALVFKLGYSLKLLWKGSISFMLVKRVETSDVCKLQLGTILWCRFLFQVTSFHAASTARELFDQLHHHSSGYRFCDLLLQPGGGLQTSLQICVAIMQHNAESQIISKRLTSEPRSTVCGSNECCSGWKKSLVEGVKIPDVVRPRSKVFEQLMGPANLQQHLKWQFHVVPLPSYTQQQLQKAV
ncbi:uncharacterized protein LOC113298140 [Papaver somniferum]|uniref:uncharacterized protein LOC113298140 n=1 Tax=Papaver somniferum TaxID=3469 RepID=UPI000E6FCFA4|nr:uncharacterized protein LOC113298140 [Papaver somniferum]